MELSKKKKSWQSIASGAATPAASCACQPPFRTELQYQYNETALFGKQALL
jgi:hypothetical protein